jgi:hypothetical protein
MTSLFGLGSPRTEQIPSGYGADVDVRFVLCWCTVLSALVCLGVTVCLCLWQSSETDGCQSRNTGSLHSFSLSKEKKKQIFLKWYSGVGFDVAHFGNAWSRQVCVSKDQRSWRVSPPTFSLFLCFLHTTTHTPFWSPCPGDPGWQASPSTALAL